MSQRLDSNGRTIWIADAHRGDGKRFVAHANEKLTAFLQLELAIRVCDELLDPRAQFLTNLASLSKDLNPGVG